MSDRLPPHLVIGALLKRVNDVGGLAVVRARGDADAGGMLLVAIEGREISVWEPGFDLDGTRVLRRVADDADSDAAVEEYWRRRRRRDPDLWVVELDVARAKRFAAESIGVC